MIFSGNDNLFALAMRLVRLVMSVRWFQFSAFEPPRHMCVCMAYEIQHLLDDGLGFHYSSPRVLLLHDENFIIICHNKNNNNKI